MANESSGEEPESRPEKAYNYILKRMLAGELPAGTPLSEASLAKELGISRTPLREAIRRLTGEGFLRQIPNRGSIVVEFAKRDIAELYELREAVEVYAIGKAAEHTLQPEAIEQLENWVKNILVLHDELVSTGEPRLTPEQMQRFVQIDLNFHVTLVRAAANRRILKAFADTRVLLNIFAMRRKGHSPNQLLEIHRYHADVLAAVVRQNSATASRLMSEHIRVSQQERLREHDEWEREAAMNHPSPTLENVVG